jgi:hypothetical protein
MGLQRLNCSRWTDECGQDEEREMTGTVWEYSGYVEGINIKGTQGSGDQFPIGRQAASALCGDGQPSRGGIRRRPHDLSQHRAATGHPPRP